MGATLLTIDNKGNRLTTLMRVCRCSNAIRTILRYFITVSQKENRPHLQRRIGYLYIEEFEYEMLHSHHILRV